MIIEIPSAFWLNISLPMTAILVYVCCSQGLLLAMVEYAVYDAMRGLKINHLHLHMQMRVGKSLLLHIIILIACVPLN